MTEYALSVLAFMATRSEALYSAELLHQELKIPKQYLRRLLTTLSKLGFIAGTRGRNGGFVFARELSGINFAQVIEATEGDASLNTCLLGHTACNAKMPCAMHDIWKEAHTQMMATLTTTSLAALREKYLRDTVLNKNKGRHSMRAIPGTISKPLTQNKS